jgi:pimeloyl-ACP methyl ester carboxylesterase
MTPIVYIHGFASGPTSGKARYLGAYLRERGASVQIPDLAEGDFAHLTITRQLAVIDRAAGGRPVSVIGSSMGGYLAALYALRHQEVDRLVLLAPAFGFAQRWPARLGEQKVANWRRTGWMDVYHYGEGRDVPISSDLLEDGPRYEGFPNFIQPALIFHGAHDDVVPASYSEEFVATHPNARLEILDSGHELTNVLDYMAPRIADFLMRSSA